VYAHFRNALELTFLHLKMISMNADGTVHLEGEIQKYLTVPRNNIPGKVLKVITFNDPE
jgi:hypothetical protein